jgi:hypothetical protein
MQGLHSCNNMVISLAWFWIAMQRAAALDMTYPVTCARCCGVWIDETCDLKTRAPRSMSSLPRSDRLQLEASSDRAPYSYRIIHEEALVRCTHQTSHLQFIPACDVSCGKPTTSELVHLLPQYFHPLSSDTHGILSGLQHRDLKVWPQQG